MLDEDIMIQGIVGSTAYGMAHPGSDIDTLGIFVQPTLDRVGLVEPEETFASNNPDITLHEVGKYCRLALKGNPTVLELLYLPEYTHLTDEGADLIEIRSSFLGSKQIRASYVGYAKAQIKRLNDIGDFGSDLKKRRAKHARHCFRLMYQAEQLLTTGSMCVKVTPEQREHLFYLGDRTTEELTDEFAVQAAKIDDMHTNLPENADFDTINSLLISIRRNHVT